MGESNEYEEYDDPPPYQEPSAIDPSALRQALCKLNRHCQRKTLNT